MAGNGETILIDMDGVLADFDDRAMSVVPVNDRMERINFYVADDYPAHKTKILDRMSEEDFFSELELVDGALEGWQKLLDNGYDPRICSAPLSANLHSVEGKIKFLDKYFVQRFGASVVERAVIDKEKYKYSGLALIDDRPEVDDGNGAAAWKHVVFDRPYNKDSLAQVRVMGWNDPELITKLDSIPR